MSKTMSKTEGVVTKTIQRKIGKGSMVTEEESSEKLPGVESDSEMARISVGKSETINMGNFESMRVPHADRSARQGFD